MFYKALHWKSKGAPPKPNVKCCLVPYKLVTHFVFEWTFFGIIIVNVVCIIAELALTVPLALTVLEYLNYVFCFIYLLEVILKVIGLRQHYFLSKWNLFDFVIFLISVIDIVVDLALEDVQLDSVAFSPSIFRVVKVLRILRVGRVLRLIKVYQCWHLLLRGYPYN